MGTAKVLSEIASVAGANGFHRRPHKCVPAGRALPSSVCAGGLPVCQCGHSEDAGVSHGHGGRGALLSEREDCASRRRGAYAPATCTLIDGRRLHALIAVLQPLLDQIINTGV